MLADAEMPAGQLRTAAPGRVGVLRHPPGSRRRRRRQQPMLLKGIEGAQ